MAVTLGSASLVGIIVESFIYGIFFVLFSYNMYLQLRNRKGPNTNSPNKLLLCASTLLFLMITGHWVVEVARLYEAVITLGGVVPLDAYFANLPAPKQVTVTGLFECSILVGDFILIYRLYHVWLPYWWICIPPMICWCALATSTGFLLYSMAHVTVATGVFINQVRNWITSSFALTITTNIYCTGLIMFRLWRGNRVAGTRVGQGYAVRVLRVFVESAALLTICFVLTFGMFEANNLVQYGLLDATSPIMGVSFTLILLRLNWSKTTGSSQIGSAIGTTRGQPTYPLRSINVNVSQAIVVDSYTGDRRDSSKASLSMA